MYENNLEYKKMNKTSGSLTNERNKNSHGVLGAWKTISTETKKDRTCRSDDFNFRHYFYIFLNFAIVKIVFCYLHCYFRRLYKSGERKKNMSKKTLNGNWKGYGSFWFILIWECLISAWWFHFQEGSDD